MPLYAQHPALRARQGAADLGMLAWAVLWILVARVVHRAVLVLAEPGRAVADLGAAVAGNMTSAAEAAGDVPLVGDDLAAPFESLADASGSARGAGQAAQDAVGTLAFVLAEPGRAVADLGAAVARNMPSAAAATWYSPPRWAPSRQRFSS